MDMSHMAMTTTATASAASSSMSMSMGGHSHDSCKISMLWNWYTVDACFLASSWQITSAGMFAGSCIGVITLVMSLEFLRRTVKEYDRYLIRRYASTLAVAEAKNQSSNGENSSSSKNGTTASASEHCITPSFRPNVFEQAIRALLHMMQFAVAYFIMLLAMYYNGYIIICIFIGAFLGAFVFQWEVLRGASGTGSTTAAREATVCCG